MADRRFSLASARQAGEEGRLPLWVGDFLASRGSDNEVLAAALAQRRHAWLGPVRVPIERIVRISGPEPDVLIPVDPDVWEDDVEAMHDAVEDGWEPPPVLIEHTDGELLLQDGTHRLEALVRAGETEAWAVVYSADEASRDRLADELERTSDDAERAPKN